MWMNGAIVRRLLAKPTALTTRTLTTTTTTTLARSFVRPRSSPCARARCSHARLFENSHNVAARLNVNVGMSVRAHGHGHKHSGEHGSVQITFKSRKDGSSKTVEAFVGDNILRCAQSHGIELEGACECSIACSTCHVILEDDLFDALPEASEEEDDMLDMAFELTPTSRLGCQVIITEDMDGAVFELPSATRNMYVDGHVPEPH